MLTGMNIRINVFTMISPLFYAIGFAALMGGLLVEVGIFRAMHDDSPSLYELFALRDKLIRLVVDQEIARRERILTRFTKM
jgi:hypothetical protein